MENILGITKYDGGLYKLEAGNFISYTGKQGVDQYLKAIHDSVNIQESLNDSFMEFAMTGKCKINISNYMEELKNNGIKLVDINDIPDGINTKVARDDVNSEKPTIQFKEADKPWIDFDEWNVISGKVAPGYYIPSIEEFHVGFEYESRESIHTDKWEKMAPIDIKCLKIILDEYNGVNYLGRKMDDDFNSLYRVKFLYKEDIESLGFEFDGVVKKGKYCYSNGDYMLILYDDKRVTIKLYDGEYKEYDIIFDGRIKNKSELKVLLKQLGIK